MATENEIVDKIREFKEKNDPNFGRYMDFYKEKFPEFFESKLKAFEAASEEKPICDDMFMDSSIMTDKPIFNLNAGKKEISEKISADFISKPSQEQKIEPKKEELKPKSKKISLIILIPLIIIGAALGTYFLMI